MSSLPAAGLVLWVESSLRGDVEELVENCWVPASRRLRLVRSMERRWQTWYGAAHRHHPADYSTTGWWTWDATPPRLERIGAPSYSAYRRSSYHWSSYKPPEWVVYPTRVPPVIVSLTRWGRLEKKITCYKIINITDNTRIFPNIINHRARFKWETPYPRKICVETAGYSTAFSRFIFKCSLNSVRC